MKPFFTFCAICCFVGIFRLPIEYYTFLRILVSVGAFILIYNFLSYKQYNMSIIFMIILIIFNPVFPVYLYRKSIWIPVDTITGILFLLISFMDRQESKEKNTSEEKTEYPKQPVSRSRDIIINPKKNKEDKDDGKQSNN